MKFALFVAGFCATSYVSAAVIPATETTSKRALGLSDQPLDITGIGQGHQGEGVGEFSLDPHKPLLNIHDLALTPKPDQPLKITGEGKGPAGSGTGVLSTAKGDSLLSIPDLELLETGSEKSNTTMTKRSHAKDLMLDV